MNELKRQCYTKGFETFCLHCLYCCSNIKSFRAAFLKIHNRNHLFSVYINTHMSLNTIEVGLEKIVGLITQNNDSGVYTEWIISWNWQHLRAAVFGVWYHHLTSSREL